MSASTTSQELSVAASLTALGQNRSKISFSSSSNSLNESLLPAGTSTNTSNQDFPTEHSESDACCASKAKLTFAQKLFDILEKPEHSHVIKWLPGGKAWIIMDKKRFTTEILPTYFKQTQFTSFTRKLSRWKFNRVSKGLCMGAYHHKFFRKDRKYLCILMSCKNEAPSLTTVANVRQIAVSKGDFGAASLAAADLEEPQKVVLKSLEDMNKLMIKEKLINIRLRKAQLAEENARIMISARALAASNIRRMTQEFQSNSALDRVKTVPNGILRRTLAPNYTSIMTSMPKFPSQTEFLRNQEPLIPQHQNLTVAAQSNYIYPSMPALPSLQILHPYSQKRASLSEEYNNCFRASAA